MGFQAGYTVTTGTGNIVIGYNKTTPAAGTNNYLNIGDIIVGDMGQKLVTVNGDFSASHFRIAGTQVLAATGGTLAVGLQAGLVNTGLNNTFIGKDAGYTNTSGGDNSFLGAYAGYSNTTGRRNIFIGPSSGFENTTGSYNTYIGYTAGESLQTGSANTMLGYQAGYGGYQSFSSSTLLGYYAGLQLETGSDNIFVGFKAGYDVTTGTGNIVIGYNIGPSAATANNEINIGGVYKGNISSGTATIPKFTVQSANAGINLTSADFGKTITVNSASAQIVNLPAVTAADIGATITIIKLGAGTVTIDAPAGVYIADSGSGGTVYNNSAGETYAAITLRLATTAKWIITGGNGSWTTTN